eukprot:CAMPEP_0171237192 /NCGR_PEP_ID=MMETSP0790-20130122/42844_1 /TAXON_ID=2925 /ORGANISM="Alexandrium catenella, Strain OF101" /LENGTH=319 /DNA_ID=CAMNT_0011703545 /DNA_START=83 /DNA_END=1042 /DNA_ORIENTATION=+
MLAVRFLSQLWLGGLLASAAPTLDDGSCLYQQQKSYGGSPKSPKIDLQKLDLSDLGSLMPRQVSAGEIEIQVRTLRNHTTWVQDLRQEQEQTAYSMSNDLAPGDLAQMTRKVAAMMSSVENAYDRHLMALGFTFDRIKQNSPPMMAMATAKGEPGLKRPAQELAKLTADAQTKLGGNISSPSDLCNHASSFLSDVQLHTKRFARACDKVLYMLPPPMPPDNPWVNSTLIEAYRAMYTKSKAAVQDMDDNLANGMSNFMRMGAGCELDITEGSEEEEEPPLPQEQQPQKEMPSQSAAFAPTWSAMALAAVVAVDLARSFV